MRPEHATPAFVLHTRPYGESDRIVTLITEHHGKLRGIAKGAKNSRRRFAGTLEPFVHVRVVFHQRTGTDLAFLVRCELLGALPSFTRDLDRFAAGSYVLELTDRMVFGREPGGEMYHLVREVLERLDAGAPVDAMLRAFELHLLARTGYAPAFDRCRGCGASTGSGPVYLALDRGGLVCRACIRAGEPVRPIGSAAATALVRLAAGSLATAPAVPAVPLAEAGRVAEHLLAQVLTAPLRSRAFLARAR